MRIWGLLLIPFVFGLKQVSKTLQKDDKVKDMEWFLKWIDYVSGIFADAGSIQMVKHFNSIIRKRYVKVPANRNLDTLFAQAVGIMNNRISEKTLVTNEKKVNINADDGNDDDELAWFDTNKDAPDCKKDSKLCDNLKKTYAAIIRGQIEKAYYTAQEMMNSKSGNKLARQFLYVATMIMYDLSMPDACVSIWPVDNKLGLETKQKILDTILTIKTGKKEYKTVKEACRQMGLGKTDLNCLYALTAAGFAPVKESIGQLTDEKEKETLQFCITGQIDPCVAVSLPVSNRIRIKRMMADFEEKCKWKRGLAEISDACPDPKASLPLLRSLNKDDQQYEKAIREHAEQDEKWFWINIYLQQCREAKIVLNELIEIFKGASNGTISALTIMREASDQCQPLKIKGLAKTEKQLGILRKLREGKAEEAINLISTATEGLSKDTLEFYKSVQLMIKYCRVLGLGELINEQLLRINDFKQNVTIMKYLDSAAKGEGLEVDLAPRTVALLLLLAERYNEVLNIFEADSIKSMDPIQSEIVATAKICLNSYEQLCSTEMGVLSENALKQTRLLSKSGLYRKIRAQLCEMSKRTERKGSSNTKLFTMLADWHELFPIEHRIYRFKNDISVGLYKTDQVEMKKEAISSDDSGNDENDENEKETEQEQEIEEEEIEEEETEQEQEQETEQEQEQEIEPEPEPETDQEQETETETDQDQEQEPETETEPYQDQDQETSNDNKEIDRNDDFFKETQVFNNVKKVRKTEDRDYKDQVDPVTGIFMDI